ncbi:phosphoglycerate dehydrogenase [Actinomarinicola tropica]|uniref:D-3-phosphoglycerate dehydrogenase n=1 Tax=Actinomarinicola tropica TaxID=2789776 RepID=A0A5Q2RKV0_9ACTN|nr:phosphoglycerate dehydrogenase [Actinomarinicola tropica]QGG94687.1 phosphoglycerate dehydrogenase [Actinomarinicola tropica]
MARILVTEKIADSGLDRLREAGHDVDVQLGLSPEQLLEAVAGAQALIIRSATKVTAEVLEAGTDLVVVGRAGLGVDNVDVQAATTRGVMVANAPGSNSLSTAEHTMAMLLAQARNIPQAHGALRDGRWEKSKWEGTELHGKTLGVLGLGRIGTLVAQRALSFGMRLVAWDPWVSVERGRQLGIEMMEIDRLFAESDFVTIHLLKTKESTGLVGEELLASAKPGLRIVNVARGGIIDEAALARAIESGHVGGAALDVFAEEPMTESPLFALDSVVATPHLGASTTEAQDKAGVIVAEQVALALAGDFVPFAVNIQASEAAEEIQPFLPLAERLGTLFFGLTDGMPETVEIEYQGNLAEYDTRIMTLSVLRGLLSNLTEEPVTYVNAPQLAESRGLKIREVKTESSQEFVNLVTLRAGDHSIAGTLAGPRGEARIVMVDDHAVDVPPAAHMVFIRNDDRPGVIGKVGTILGDAGVNIADMGVGQSPAGESALMVIATSQPVPGEVVETLAAADGITSVHAASRTP